MAEVGAQACYAFIDLRYFHAGSIVGSIAVSTAFYFAGQLALGSAQFPGVLPNESRVLYLDAIRQCEVMFPDPDHHPQPDPQRQGLCVPVDQTQWSE